jgi:hypothetical protein
MLMLDKMSNEPFTGITIELIGGITYSSTKSYQLLYISQAPLAGFGSGLTV